MYCDTQKQYCYNKGAACYTGCTMGPPVSSCYHACDVAEDQCNRAPCKQRKQAGTDSDVK